MPLLQPFRLLINTPHPDESLEAPRQLVGQPPPLAAEGLAFSLLREVNGRKLGHKGAGLPRPKQRTLLEQGQAAVVVGVLSLLVT